MHPHIPNQSKETSIDPREEMYRWVMEQAWLRFAERLQATVPPYEAEYNNEINLKA